ncbi:TRAP transporter large permease subunit [Selenomonadales bacterium OttesenSCG-928-I06]|nr:TRAP transporter large permease subunit [Selenomonadales bacterium OttesenSCG-928-I06]
MLTALLFLLFIGMLLASVPVALCMVVATGIILASSGDFTMYMVTQRMFSTLTNPTLMAIPAFIFAGVLMARGGIARYLIEAVQAWVGHFPGGLAVVSTLCCMIFGAICGSSPATAVAIGSIMIPGMVKAGYDKKYAMGLIAASGTLGILIPPSIPLVIYGVTAEESIGKLFMAGIVPGIILGLSIMTLAVIRAKRLGYGSAEKATWEERWQKTFKALPGAFLPVLILGSIYSGIATPTESAVIASMYTIIVSAFVYRELKLPDIRGIMVESVGTASMLYLIISCAMVFALYLTNAQVPHVISQWIADNNIGVIGFFMMTALMFFVMGTFLEAASIILITLPLLLPIMKILGISPIHFAIVMVVNMELAQITPPVGLNLFVVSSISRATVEQVVRGVIPYIILMFIVMIVFMFFPQISLWLPDMM